MLLGSPPDMVHGTLSHRTRPFARPKAYLQIIIQQTAENYNCFFCHFQSFSQIYRLIIIHTVLPAMLHRADTGYLFEKWIKKYGQIENEDI